MDLALIAVAAYAVSRKPAAAPFDASGITAQALHQANPPPVEVRRATLVLQAAPETSRTTKAEVRGYLQDAITFAKFGAAAGALVGPEGAVVGAGIGAAAGLVIHWVDE